MSLLNRLESRGHRSGNKLARMRVCVCACVRVCVRVCVCVCDARVA